jgi:hypothetical protein
LSSLSRFPPLYQPHNAESITIAVYVQAGTIWRRNRKTNKISISQQNEGNAEHILTENVSIRIILFKHPVKRMIRSIARGALGVVRRKRLTLASPRSVPGILRFDLRRNVVKILPDNTSWIGIPYLFVYFALGKHTRICESSVSLPGRRFVPNALNNNFQLRIGNYAKIVL